MTRIRKKKWQPEIVRLLTPEFLVNSARQACRYETVDGRILAPGYYLALLPVGGQHSGFGQAVRYFGPFATSVAARFLQTSAMALGIVDAAVPAPTSASATRMIEKKQSRPLYGAAA